MIINKALVHKGSIPLVQMFFSDVSTIIMFQSLKAFPQKSKDCKIVEANSPYESKAKHTEAFVSFPNRLSAKGFYFLLYMQLPQ